MKKRCRRTVAILLTFCLLILQMGAAVLAAEEVIVNGTFEQGTKEWISAGASVVATAAQQHSGRASCRVTDRTENWSSVQQWITIQDGQTYTVSVWVKLASGSDTVHLVTDVYTAKDKLQPIMASATVGTEWTNLKATYRYEIGASIESAKIYVRTETSLEDMYVDDFQMVKGSSLTGSADIEEPENKEPPVNPESTNPSLPDIYQLDILKNGGFEDGIGTWKSESAKLELSTDRTEGAQALAVSGDTLPLVVETQAQLRTGKSYLVNAWVKTEQTGSVQLRARLGGSGEPQEIPLLSQSVQAGEWTQIYGLCSFTDYGTFDNAALIVEADGAFLLDGVRLYEVSGKLEAIAKDPEAFRSAAAQGSNQNYIKGGSFESGVSDWITSESTIGITSDEAHSGASSCLVSNRMQVWGSAQQWVDLKANVKYTARAWVKLASGSDTMQLNLDYYQGETKKSVMVASATVGTEWVELSGEFSVTDIPEISKSKVYIVTGSSKENYYLDDFSLFEAGASTATQVDSVDDTYLVKGMEDASWDDLYYFDFSAKPYSAYALAGFRVENGSMALREEEGKTALDFLSEDPQMVTPEDVYLDIDAQKYPYIRICMKNTVGASKGELYFATQEQDSFTDSRKVDLPLSQGGQYREYVLDLSKHPEWTGRITKLRLDPVDALPVSDGIATGSVALSYIAVSAVDEGSFFTDLEGHWAKEDVEQLALGHALDVEEEAFRPDEAVSRADFVDMLMRGLDLVPRKIRESGLRDVSGEEAWHQSLLAACEMGVVLGDDGAFRPSDPITRQESAAMILRCCDYFERRGVWQKSEVQFLDHSQISPWALDSVYACSALGLFQGEEDGRFAPLSNITRAQSAALARRIRDWVNGCSEKGVFLSGEQVATYDIVRINLNDPRQGDWQNPYQSSEVEVYGRFTAPSGETMVLPAYFELFEDYTFEPRRAKKEMSSKAFWKLRFAPTEVGEWTFDIVISDSSGQQVLASSSLYAAQSDSPGFVQVDPENPRFIYENQEPFFGVGLNLCWADGENGNVGPGMVSYEDYFKDYVEDNGVNFMRIWLENLEGGMENRYTGLNVFDSKYSGRLDYFMRYARDNGVHIVSSIKTHHYLVTGRWWDDGVYTTFNGGPLELPRDVFTNEQTRASFKDLLRYLVARYSAYDNLVSWEFWNEEQGVDGYASHIDSVCAWHDEMTAYLESIDPYQHVMGTSFTDIVGTEEVQKKDSIEYLTAHSYGTANWPEIIRANTLIKEQMFGPKPSYFQEQGLRIEHVNEDPEGINVHNGLWAAFAAGDTATAMQWWWDSYLSPNGLYRHYGPVAKLAQQMHWPDENVRQVEFATTSSIKGDTIIPAGYDITSDRYPNMEFTLDFVNGVLPKTEDVIYARDVRTDTPYTFHVNLKENSALLVTFMGTPILNSPGGVVQVSVDGEVVFEQEADAAKTANQFRIPLPRGEHTVVLANTGTQAYSLGNVAFENTQSIVEAVGAVGDHNGIIWIRDTKNTWVNKILGYQPQKIEDASVDLTGLDQGEYLLTWWDTYQGVELGSQTITVTEQGGPVISVPAFEKDIALKVEKQET